MAIAYAEHFMKKFQEDDEELDLIFDF